MNNNIIEKKELINVIEQALYSEELAIFAGAGLSIEAGYYSWENLLSKPADELKLDIKKENNDLVSLAQFYCNTKKEGPLMNYYQVLSLQIRSQQKIIRYYLSFQLQHIGQQTTIH